MRRLERLRSRIEGVPCDAIWSDSDFDRSERGHHSGASWLKAVAARPAPSPALRRPRPQIVRYAAPHAPAVGPSSSGPSPPSCTKAPGQRAASASRNENRMRSPGMPQQAVPAPLAPVPEPARSGSPKPPATAVGVPPHLRRDRSRHQQLPPARRAPDRRRLHRHRRLLARRPARRGHGDQRQDRRRRDGPRGRRAFGLRREIEAPPRQPRPLGRDRGLPPRGQRPPFRRAGAARDRHLPRDHRARGGSAARHARLPPPARARRRPGPDLRHRRRLDRAGPDRHRRAASPGSNAGGARPGAWSR